MGPEKELFDISNDFKDSSLKRFTGEPDRRLLPRSKN
jgi:hypothetical protein